MQNYVVPLSSTRAGYEPEHGKVRYRMNSTLIADKYRYEKFMGKRKANGALKLNSLRPEHKQYITAYIQGKKGVEIAEDFNVAAITVYRVLADPLARSMISEFDLAFQDEFKRMFPLVADAVRKGLDSGSETTRLKAVDRWAKIVRQIDGEPEDDEKKKVEKIQATRMRFIGLVKDLIPSVIIESEDTPLAGVATEGREKMAPIPALEPPAAFAVPVGETEAQADLFVDDESDSIFERIDPPELGSNDPIALEIEYLEIERTVE